MPHCELKWEMSDKRISRRYNKSNKRRYRNISVFGKILNFVLNHKLLVLSLLAIIWLLTLRGAAAFWVVLIMIAIGPGILMFIIYNLIAKAIWRR